MTRHVMLSFLQSLTGTKRNAKRDKITDEKSIKSISSSKSSKKITKQVKSGKGTAKTRFSLRKSSSTNSVSLKLRSVSPSNEPSTSVHSSPSSSSKVTIETHTPSKSSSNCNNTLMSETVTHKESISSIKSDSKSSNKQSELSNSLKPAVLTSNVMPNLKKTSSESPSSSSSLSLAPAPSTTATVQATLLSCDPTLKHLSSDSNVSLKKASSKTDAPEKKRKAISNSRQKKFHRQFQQVSPDEQVLNYFSCALVSDILLQGYLYITENHFAFYSNVFGYVTRLLIPVTSVTKISKEKTVKIFPNAIAVCTSDERHVFSSFLSRETAYQLMISVWQDAVIHRQFQSSTLINTPTATSLVKATTSVTDTSSSASTELLLSKSNDEPDTATSTTSTTPNTVAAQCSNFKTAIEHLDVSELDEDSSSAISGSECLRKRFLQQEQQIRLIKQQTLSQVVDSSELVRQSYSIIPDFQVGTLKSKDLSWIRDFQSKIPQTVPAVYFGLSLILILALLAWFLLYRISELRSNKIFSIEDLDEGLPSNIKVFADLLKWQKDMQTQKVQLTQNVLNTNLEQITKISENLEKLSRLIQTNKIIDIDDDISSVIGACDTNESSAASNICS